MYAHQEISKRLMEQTLLLWSLILRRSDGGDCSRNIFILMQCKIERHGTDFLFLWSLGF